LLYVLAGFVQAADDAADAQWFPVSQLPPLAFDHQLIVRECLQHAANMPEAQDKMKDELLRAAERLAGDWRHHLNDEDLKLDRHS
jgi:hypothetical protein